jgi:hypothetical protein
MLVAPKIGASMQSWQSGFGWGRVELNAKMHQMVRNLMYCKNPFALPLYLIALKVINIVWGSFTYANYLSNHYSHNKIAAHCQVSNPLDKLILNII